MVSEVAQQLFAWQQARKKPEASGEPVSGFGPEGQHTLWLPQSGPSQKLAIVDGKPTMTEVPGVDADPEIEQLRMDILMGCREIGPGLLSIPIKLVTYAIGLIRCNYNVTDAELTMLLTSNPEMPWGPAVFEHAMGGRDFPRLFAQAGPLAKALIDGARADLDAVELVRNAASLPPPKRSFWSRLFGR